MAIRLAIVDSKNNEVMTYPSEEFLKEFIEELPSRWFFVKSDHFRKKHIQKVMEKLVQKFKDKTINLPPGVI